MLVNCPVFHLSGVRQVNLNLCSLCWWELGGNTAKTRRQVFTPLVGILHSVILSDSDAPRTSLPALLLGRSDARAHRSCSPAWPASPIALPLPSQLSRIFPENPFLPITHIFAAITHSPNSLWKCPLGGPQTLLNRFPLDRPCALSNTPHQSLGGLDFKL